MKIGGFYVVSKSELQKLLDKYHKYGVEAGRRAERLDHYIKVNNLHAVRRPTTGGGK